MALLKEKTSKKGFLTLYHKITNVTLKDNILNCLLSSYVSYEYRNLEQPAENNILHFSITLEEEESMGIRQLAYKKIKELEEWSDATDC